MTDFADNGGMEVRLADATIDWDRLRDPFPDHDLDWKPQKTGWGKNGRPYALVVPYVKARAIMDRLDEVVGPDRWVDSYRQWQTSKDGTPAVTCGLSILVRGEWLTKWDGAPETKIEPTKGGFSDALKRAAVHWGIGRWLYSLDETWADTQATPPRSEVSRYWKKTAALVDKRDKNSWKDFWWQIPLLDSPKSRGKAEPRRTTNEPDERDPAQRIVDWVKKLETLKDAGRARAQIQDGQKYQSLGKTAQQRVWFNLMAQTIRLAQDKDELENVLELLRRDKTEGSLTAEQFAELAAQVEGKL